MGLHVKFWGVRGSLATPQTPRSLEEKMAQILLRFVRSGGKTEQDVHQFLSSMSRSEFQGYGGHTSCVEVENGSTRLIIDGGSGIKNLGDQLMKTDLGKGKGEIDILLTHFHWDHLVGFPFFTPLYIPGNKIRIHCSEPELEEAFRILFRKPFFPVPFESLAADITFHHLKPREKNIFGKISVTPYRLDHPDPCWGFKIESEGRVLSYCVDTEAVRRTPESLGQDLPLYQGVHTLIFDAQYTLEELGQRIDWGHASAPLGLDIAIREKIEKVYFVHHDPSALDDKIGAALEQTAAYLKYRQHVARVSKEELHGLQWEFAYEGLKIAV